MSRPIVLHICLAFSSLLFLSFATQCLAFPKLERRETAHAYAEGLYERMDTDDQESSSIALKHTPQQMFSEDTTILSTGSTVTPLDKAFSTNEETHLPGARLLQPNSPESPPLHTAIEPTSEEVHGSSESERMSSEHRHSKDLLTIPVIAIASLSPDEKGPFSSSSTQPLAEGMTAATQGFLNYVDNQLFATESQKRVSLGHSPSSYINTKEMLTTNPGTEEVHLDASQRTTSFPGVDSIASTEPDGVQPSQMTADNDQTTMTKHLMATSEYALSVEPETDSRLEAPEATLSVSTAVPAASVMSDEWDDTKLESISQKRPPESGDNPETPVRIEPPKTTHLSLEGAEGDLPSTVVAEVAPELNEGETPMGTALLITQGGERSLILTHQSSFTTTSLMDDTGVSIVNLFQSTGGSTEEDGATFFSETTASVSEYESEVYQSLGVTLKEIITQEMTTATPELEATLPVLTQEQVATIEVTRDGVEVEEDLVDTVTGPNEEFTPVLGAPETISGTTVEVPTIFPVLPSEGRTVSSISHNTAASYDLDQLESKEGEDEDEEDEEDEDEEEEDEEEDEEDKDTDALDESFDGDTELPGFTVPGVTSQEPGIESGNMDLLEGATYQVPDAIEWEQQNQGLVRSWMEKLKDKAGYMSGMLVPVGVGIAGALFILAALYSIKVMNRRRRNGFKRHKRKREFNSMQDRVMLLADSSEDEF